MFDEFKSAFQRHNNVHAQLIIINVVVFLVLATINVFSSLSGYPEFFMTIFKQLALPTEFSAFLNKPWTIITHAFVHDFSDILHILFNMLAFYWFGRLIIEYLGSDKLIAIYVLGFLAGAIVLLFTHNTIPFYIARNSGIAFGASAAVNAAIVAAATLLPNYTFYLMFIGPVKIKYIALFYVVASFVGSVGSNAGGDVAHLGGALMGFVYIKQLQAGINWGLWITVTIDWFKDLFKNKPKVKVTYRGEEKTSSKKPFTPASKASQAEIDIILDKISDRGYESLTKEEKEKLFNASKK
jgi:membrane associated rhomboid family serine protease